MQILYEIVDVLKEDWLVILFLFLFSYKIRELFLTISSGDIGYTLYQFKKTRINKFGEHWAKDSIIPGIIAYPTLLHWFYARIPSKIRISAAYFFNTLYDCLNVVVFYFACRIGLSHFVLNISLDAIVLYSLCFSVLYSTCPLFFPLTERIKNFGGRTFGVLMFVLMHCSYYRGFYETDYLFYFIAGIFGLIIILSSWFAMQAMIFSFLWLSILYLSVNPVIFLLILFGGALLLPGVGVKTLLTYKINQSIWYWRNYKKHRQTNSHNSIKLLIDLPQNFLKNRKQFWLTLLYHNGFIMALISLAVIPISFLLAKMVGVNLDILLHNSILQYSFYLILSMFFSFIITGIKPFIIFGQNERYLEYAAPYIYIIYCFIAISLNFYTSIIITLLLILYQIIIILTSYKVNIKYLSGFQTDKNLIQKISVFINSFQEPMRLLFYPAKDSFELSYYTNNPIHKFYYMFVSNNKIEGIPTMETDLQEYNRPITDVSYFRSQYNINTIVINKNLYPDYKNMITDNPDCLFENNTHIIYYYK